MAPRILIAPDKFKGSLSAGQAAAAMQAGVLTVWPEAECVCRPVADGGEGTAEAMCQALGGEWVETVASDPLGRPVKAHYAWLPGATAVIDMSEASGLWRLRPEERNPLLTSTRGTGELMQHALQRGAHTLVVGLGGSATNDGGLGMAQALGFEFLDRAGERLGPTPESLSALASVHAPSAWYAASGRRSAPQVLGLCDVRNPLLGERGASRIFGPQKGASPEMVEQLDALLARLAEVVRRDLGQDHASHPGSGAAGGLGFGLLSFCGASLKPGFETLAGILQLERLIADCDLVLTGEGRIDAQTLEGKAPAGVAALARQHGRPVLAFGGSVEPGLAGGGGGFDAVIPISPPGMPLVESMAKAASLLTEACATQLPHHFRRH
jgi:glycerate kinase